MECTYGAYRKLLSLLRDRAALRPGVLCSGPWAKYRGFPARLSDTQDAMRLPAVYCQQDVATEHFESFDGEM